MSVVLRFHHTLRGGGIITTHSSSSDENREIFITEAAISVGLNCPEQGNHNHS
tara:strand:+ start:235 stop:393 length:159 start_codon:yes stop_codon:yes gene_type:complete